MLVIMHCTLCISHYASFGTHSKLSNFWVTSDSLWVEPLLYRIEKKNTLSRHVRHDQAGCRLDQEDDRIYQREGGRKGLRRSKSASKRKMVI